MNIINSPPIVSAGEIEVAADPKIIWDVMAGIHRWVAWSPNMKSAFLDGRRSSGSKFR